MRRFTRHFKRQKPIMDINMTPLMDLTFMLLIIFIITVPVLDYSTDVTPPRLTSDQQVDGEAPKSITVERHTDSEAWGAVFATFLTPMTDASPLPLPLPLPVGKVKDCIPYSSVALICRMSVTLSRYARTPMLCVLLNNIIRRDALIDLRFFLGVAVHAPVFLFYQSAYRDGGGKRSCGYGG